MMRPDVLSVIVAGALFAVACLPQTSAKAAPVAAPGHFDFCAACISIRVGPASAVRGPIATQADNLFTAIRLRNGAIRGFTANATTLAVDGATPHSMSGPGQAVLVPGAAGTLDDCGQWLNHAERAGSVVFGFIHDERACHESDGQTVKSMSMALSKDDGLTWEPLGQFITGTDKPTPNEVTGEGDCSVVKDHDTYYYAYCIRARDWATIVARAPASDAAPKMWLKYWDHGWSQPGLAGNASPLGLRGDTGSIVGTGAFSLSKSGLTGLFGLDRNNLQLLLSSDHVTFQTLAEPLLPLDPQSWIRPTPFGLVAYPTMIDAMTGSNVVSDDADLVYTYLKPGEGFDRRYLVFQPVRFTIHAQPVSPQVGVALARWYDKDTHSRLSTAGPVDVDQGHHVLEATNGYVLTKPADGQTSVKLTECAASVATTTDHLFSVGDVCPPQSTKIRTAGWLFSTATPGTEELFSCVTRNGHSHFLSNTGNCDHDGKKAALLGYVLKD